MTDREMLEFAAKAAGYALQWGEKYDVGGDVVDCTDMAYITINGVAFAEHWNPLLDNADAFTLAVKLGLDLLRTERDIEAIAGLPPYASMKRDVPAPIGIELLGDDAYAATRRAITRAAAEIGRGMP